MDSKELLKEISAYSEDELELIIDTQKDLYSPEEMALIEQELEHRKKGRHHIKTTSLPKEINCPRCGASNPFENDACQYCGFSFAKKECYIEDIEEEEEEEDSSDEDDSPSYSFIYFISFLIPLVGFIVGAIYLGKDTPDQRNVGKKSIIWALIGICVAVFIWVLIYQHFFS